MAEVPRAYISLADIPSAIRKLTRRLNELEKQPPVNTDTDFTGLANEIATKVNATVDDVFGKNTQEARTFNVSPFSFWGGSPHPSERVQAFNKTLSRTIAMIKVAIEGLQEKSADAEEDATERTLRAYQGLSLHEDIAGAASKLYVAMVTTQMPLETR